ncbi:sensor histidine kinase [Altererythrobacter sp. CAU 1778]
MNVYLLLELIATISLCVMIVLTITAFSGQTESNRLFPAERAATLLVGTLLPALTLIVLIGRRIALRRAAGSTARLHVRLVFFFSLVAAIPTVIVAIFASFLFQSAIEFWFSDRSRSLMENANQLARGYYEENQRDIQNQVLAMAGDLRYYLEQDTILSDQFAEGYSLQVLGREMNESAIIRLEPNGALSVAAIVDPDEDIERPRMTLDDVAKIDRGTTVVITSSAERLEAITPIDRDAGLFLYAARNSDALALSQYDRARTVVQEYDSLIERARVMQLRLNLGMLFAALALVAAAVWFALRFADRQVRPLTELVSAARQVGSGNFAMRVEGRTGADEIGLVNRAFNRMAGRIEQQTSDLIGANRQLDERRNFIEAVLESVSSGIITTDRDGQILLMNGKAQELLLDAPDGGAVGGDLNTLAPAIGQMLGSGETSNIVQYGRDGDLKTLAVKIAPSAEGNVITFEDITRQIIDQRQAAWSDVARRIAHEIKNPLTPIQLATERLNRRYAKQIENDRELFEELTSTIIRQVRDLRKMVDEFSSFARLPKPVFRSEDLVDLAKQALFLQEVARSEIGFGFSTDHGSLMIACDRHQIGQALTNILKNATEAVEAQAQKSGIDYRGKISLRVETAGDHARIIVEDNGIGLPQDRERLVEPYVTTREKGTGLGLAIVKKIVEEHGGEMTFAAREGGGTIVTLTVDRDPSNTAPAGRAG